MKTLDFSDKNCCGISQIIGTNGDDDALMQNSVFMFVRANPAVIDLPRVRVRQLWIDSPNLSPTPYIDMPWRRWLGRGRRRCEI